MESHLCMPCFWFCIFLFELVASLSAVTDDSQCRLLYFYHCSRIYIAFDGGYMDEPFAQEQPDKWPFNNENESFMQETKLMVNEYSINLPTKFCYKKSNGKDELI